MALEGAVLSDSGVSAALNTVYAPALIEQIEQRMELKNRLPKIADTAWVNEGSTFVVKMRKGHSNGFGAVAQTYEDYKAPGAAQFVEATIPVKVMTGTIGVPQQTMKRAQTNRGAVVDFLEDELASMAGEFAVDYERQMCGNGGGILATISSFSNGTGPNGGDVVTVDSTRFIRLGMPVDIFATNADDAALISSWEAAGCKVTAVMSSTTFEISTASTPASPNVVRRHGTHASGASTSYEVTGFNFLVDSTGTLQGINRANNYWFQSTVVQNNGGSGNANLNMKKLAQAYFGPEEMDKGAMTPDLCISKTGVFMAYTEILKTDRRFSTKDVLDHGHARAEFFGTELLNVPSMVSNTIIMLQTGDFARAELGDMEWVKNAAGGVLHLAPGNGTGRHRAQWLAYLEQYFELAAKRLNRSAKLTEVHEYWNET